MQCRVVGRFGPGVPGPHDDLEVEFTARTGPFAMSTTPDILLRYELAEWVECLDQLASGATVVWRDSGRTLELTFAPVNDGVRVTVNDEPGSGAELVLPIYPDHPDWSPSIGAYFRTSRTGFHRSREKPARVCGPGCPPTERHKPSRRAGSIPRICRAATASRPEQAAGDPRGFRLTERSDRRWARDLVPRCSP